MKYFILVIVVSLSIFACAQSERVIYHQDQKIAELMNAYKSYHRKSDLLDGYRIQIAFANDRQEVYNSKAKLYKDFPNDKCYVEYEQPYYKLRLGDFTTRLAAYDKLQSVLNKYQGAFIVRDKVKP